MDITINLLRLPMPLNVTYVNSYLLKSGDNFFLIDTGMTNSRAKLDSELERLGCHSGDLKLILLTHGDFDHTGNAVYLRERVGAAIAMHEADAGMLEDGDMFYNRKFENRTMRNIMKSVMPFKENNRGKPDIFLADGDSLSAYGIDLTVYNTPGHSTGSVCFLSPAGDLFAGDLMTNSTGKPRLNSMLYDHAAGIASLQRLKTLNIKTVYPGHGAPFAWEKLEEPRIQLYR